MSKNSLINIKPKTKDNIIKDENFSNTRENTFLLGAKGIDETICISIKKNFELKNNLSLKDKEIVLKVLKSYKKIANNESLNEDEFVLSKHEINEFLSLENKNILRYTVYRYKYNVYPKLKILEEYPPNIQIEPTSMCNLRCIMCYQSDKSFSSKSAGFMGYMKLDLLKKIIDEIEGKIEAVTFASRGEPTLHSQLDEFLKYCEGKFLGLKLNTNATLLDEKKINSILSSDLQSLVLSIDEKNKENYEKIRVNAKFEKVMKNLNLLKNIREKNYKSSKLQIRISGVKINTEQNVEEMNQFYKEFADEIALVNYSPWESAYDNEINNIEDVCSELYRRIFVWQDGKVNPCDYDYKSLLSKWNANQDSIKSIWNSNYYNEIRNLHKSKNRKKIEPCNRCIGI
jgi:radical SAM protein with 4Fe4S-binding SPASM domain